MSYIEVGYCDVMAWCQLGIFYARLASDQPFPVIYYSPNLHNYFLYFQSEILGFSNFPLGSTPKPTRMQIFDSSTRLESCVSKVNESNKTSC